MRSLTRNPYVIVGFFLLSACCSTRLDYDTFRSLPPDKQLISYEKAKRDHCIREGEGVFQALIADHGYQAADSVVALVRQPDSTFPLDDAITILELIHVNGYDLRHHEAMHLLEDLAKSSSDPAVRRKAATAVERIQKHN
jgi:hypothetical protein